MGWTYLNRDTSKTLREFFAREFTPYEVVDFSTHGSKEAYAILRHPESGKVFGLVILLDKRSAKRALNGMTFGYKDMDERMGPLYYNAPRRMLDRLDREAPLDDVNDPRGDARRWRQLCRERSRAATTTSATAVA
jgi:hypothetical protein